MKSNYHTHTQHCRHAAGLPEDYISKAIEAGLSEIGISDHAPFEGTDFGYRMPYEELDIYLDEIHQSQEKHKNEIKVLKSLEIEWLPEFDKEKNYYQFLLNDKKMDYLLLGQHFFHCKTGEIVNITGISKPELAVEYALSCAEAMNTGYFKIMAHPDLFCINEGFSWNDSYEKASDILIEASLKTGVILEYNANGYRRGIKSFPDGERYQYPHVKFWEKVKTAGCRAIVGSDCHNPAVLWDDAVEKSIETLSKIGINRLQSL